MLYMKKNKFPHTKEVFKIKKKMHVIFCYKKLSTFKILLIFSS